MATKKIRKPRKPLKAADKRRFMKHLDQTEERLDTLKATVKSIRSAACSVRFMVPSDRRKRYR